MAAVRFVFTEIVVVNAMVFLIDILVVILSRGKALVL
jgi:hypothetical protein